MKRVQVSLALSAVLLGAAAFGADKAKEHARDEAMKYPIPGGLKGFDGTLEGKVVSVQEHMRGFVLRVDQIMHVNQRSTAPNPQAVVGKEIEITPTTMQNDKGKWAPDEQELKYIKSLEKGQDLQIDVTNTDQMHLRIADLTKAEKMQADMLKKKGK